jgi:hypothetical protein
MIIGQFRLASQGDGPKLERDGHVELLDHGRGLQIFVEGHGEKTAMPGKGTPIYIEIWEGKLRVILWSDINKEDGQVIDMDGAREELLVPESELPARK